MCIRDRYGLALHVLQPGPRRPGHLLPQPVRLVRTGRPGHLQTSRLLTRGPVRLHGRSVDSADPRWPEPAQQAYNSLPRSFTKAADGSFQRLVPARKSLDSHQAQEQRSNCSYFLKRELCLPLQEIPPLPESVLQRNSKPGKRKMADGCVSSTWLNIEDTFI